MKAPPALDCPCRERPFALFAGPCIRGAHKLLQVGAQLACRCELHDFLYRAFYAHEAGKALDFEEDRGPRFGATELPIGERLGERCQLDCAGRFRGCRKIGRFVTGCFGNRLQERTARPFGQRFQKRLNAVFATAAAIRALARGPAFATGAADGGAFRSRKARKFEIGELRCGEPSPHCRPPAVTSVKPANSSYWRMAFASA